jgi:hypothetical protein
MVLYLARTYLKIELPVAIRAVGGGDGHGTPGEDFRAEHAHPERELVAVAPNGGGGRLLLQKLWILLALATSTTFCERNGVGANVDRILGVCNARREDHAKPRVQEPHPPKLPVDFDPGSPVRFSSGHLPKARRTEQFLAVRQPCTSVSSSAMSVHCSSCDRRVAYLAGKAGGEGVG